MPSVHDPNAIVYRIDAANRISHVNAAWSEFARNNQGQSLLPEHILGSNLLESITDLTLRELYIRLIRSVRAGKALRFHYRCDAPDRRRTYEMVIRSAPGGEVEFISTLQHEAARPPVAVLELGRHRDERLLHICSWCQQVEMPDKSWMPVEAAVEALHLLEAETFPQLTHGICAPCRAHWLPEDAA